MKVLLLNVKIHQDCDFTEPLNLLIDGGIISYIGFEQPQSDIVYDLIKHYVSAGWFDLHCRTNDPGSTLRDDLDSVTNSAIAGGYTNVAVRPTLEPAAQTREWCQYLLAYNEQRPIKFHPIVLATRDSNGRDINELNELVRSGAVAFSDGDKAIAYADVFARLLQYSSPLSKRVFEFPNDPSLSKNGQINEGPSSLITGLKGIPSIAECLIVQRDLELLKYYGGALHFSSITTARSIELIKAAKGTGLNVTCDVPAHYLWFNESHLNEFNTNLKVLPPFRSVEDQKAIIKALQDGTIDAVVSGHQGCDEESKQLEFDLADFGVETLETTFSVLNTATHGVLSLNRMLELLCLNPRRILGIPEPVVAVGSKAELTIFENESHYLFKESYIKSKSKNNPFVGSTLKGKVWGVYNNSVLHIRHYDSE